VVFRKHVCGYPKHFCCGKPTRVVVGLVILDNTKEDKQSLMRFIYYGASIELFFIISSIITIYTILALLFRPLMWKTVTTLELIANTTGRFFAWAGLTMVLVQIVIIFAQRVFAVSQITIGFGLAFSFDVSWWA
jgi:hypothetical protein